MSSLRDLVTGSDGCSAGDGAGPSNALSSLVDNMLGAGKTQQQLQELPSMLPQAAIHRQPGLQLTPQEMAKAHAAQPHMHIPGLAPPPQGVEADVAAFLGGQADAQPNMEQIFRQIQGQQQGPPGVHPAHRMEVLHSAFASFLHSGPGSQAWAAGMLPDVRLSVQEQCKVRDRTTILARQVFADRGDQFADSQVSNLLSSLNINPHALPADAEHRSEAWEGIWGRHRLPDPSMAEAAAADGGLAAKMMPPSGWVEDFAQSSQGPPAEWLEEFDSGTPWVQEFAQQSGWAEEFQTAQTAAEASGASREVGEAEALHHTRALAETLAADSDPKFQNSKFLQFVSKMSRGELVMENNGVVERTPAEVGSSWADEFRGAASNDAMEQAWANTSAPPTWAQEFQEGPDEENYFDAWVEQFAEEGGPRASTFGDSWLEEYQDQLANLNLGAENGETMPYEFAPVNPFLEDPDPLARGKELFRTGVLSEAALALEAAVQRDPQSVEAWRLLGTVHAENDDDKQAIRAMMHALKQGPTDTQVMLSLGVSHTNELDQQHALGHLDRWISSHPVHGPMAAAAKAHGAEPTLQGTIDLFEAALANAPRDAEIASALGVLYNLSRKFDAAVRCFRQALEIQPNDYSLWNKLGATLANSARSGEAISAYRKALDLKPNYMRAWTNLGISYANLAEYEASAKYYIQALELNPNAASVWSYLKTSLLCAGRSELLPALEASALSSLRAGLGV